MHETFHELIEHLGGTPITPMPTKEENYEILPGGRIIHEVGVTRMGDSARTSVLNAHCQAHDVKNVFVADGGPLVSNPNKNPTWTILALAMRTSDYIAEQRRQGSI
jgi:choline dehydrogenase-like flavoprotein